MSRACDGGGAHLATRERSPCEEGGEEDVLHMMISLLEAQGGYRVMTLPL